MTRSCFAGIHFLLGGACLPICTMFNDTTHYCTRVWQRQCRRAVIWLVPPCMKHWYIQFCVQQVTRPSFLHKCIRVWLRWPHPQPRSQSNTENMGVAWGRGYGCARLQGSTHATAHNKLDHAHYHDHALAPCLMASAFFIVLVWGSMILVKGKLIEPCMWPLRIFGLGSGIYIEQLLELHLEKFEWDKSMTLPPHLAIPAWKVWKRWISNPCGEDVFYSLHWLWRIICFVLPAYLPHSRRRFPGELMEVPSRSHRSIEVLRCWLTISIFSCHVLCAHY